jgi:hypothetical protein
MPGGIHHTLKNPHFSFHAEINQPETESYSSIHSRFRRSIRNEKKILISYMKKRKWSKREKDRQTENGRSYLDKPARRFQRFHFTFRFQ